MANINIPIPQNPIGENYPWRDWFQKLSNQVFGTMALQNSNNVNVTGGQLTIGNNPVITGSGVNTSMTGSGATVFNNGSFAIGDSTANIASDGTTVVLNGFVYGIGNNLGNFTLGSAASATLLSFSTSKVANTIVTCSGNYFVNTSSTTTATRPTSFTSNGVFTVNNSLGSSIGGFTIIYNSNLVIFNNTSPYNTQFVSAFSFSILLQNLAAGSYTLVCNGPTTYSNTHFYDNVGGSITPTSANIQLTTNSYWYQVG
jgi:hypothetical protein